MMKHTHLFCFLTVSLVFIKCNYNEENCSLKDFNFANQKYQAKGCLIDNLEKGEWAFYNASNQLIEKGVYENGFKVGKWHYPQNQSDKIIEWRKYDKKNLELTFNIPVLLEIVEDSSEYIKFSNKDTSKLFIIVLSIHEIEKSKKTIEDYYKQGEEEIIANGWTFTSNKNKIKTNESSLYFNQYTINTDKSEKFNILNAYGLINSKMIFEISCRFNDDIQTSAKIIFFSVLTNSFYQKKRFMNPWEKIESFITN